MGKNQDPGSGINIPEPQHCRQKGVEVRVIAELRTFDDFDGSIVHATLSLE
jgi:hypothetical protein